jgi:H+/gluconate symporter-like permease
MNFLVLLASLLFLMLITYHGYSVILVAPVAALAAVLLTCPSLVAPGYSNVFMVKMADFIRNYFPVFLLAAIIGKVIGAVFILISGLLYHDRQRSRAEKKREGYGFNHINETEIEKFQKLMNPWIAALPLIVVGVMNKVFTIVTPLILQKDAHHESCRCSEAGLSRSHVAS